MLRKFFASCALSCAVFTVQAQQNSIEVAQNPAADSTVAADETEKKPLTISGSVDAYYRYNFNKQVNNYTSFTNTQNTFVLGMASVKFDYATGKTKLVADLGFGPRAQEFAYNDNGLLAAVKQMYVSYSPTNNLTFTAGSWATHVGYELVDPQLNKNYSMSYLFTNGPFSHTGIKAELAAGKSGFMLGISNPTDYRVVPEGSNKHKFAIAQYSYAPTDKIKLYLNYVGGENLDTSKVNQYDLVLTAGVTSKFDIGFNASLNSSKAWDGTAKQNLDSKKWWGAAAYLNVAPADNFGLTLRSEVFNDKENVKGFNSNIFANTLSANFKVDGLTIIPELRIENAGQPIYFDKDGLQNKKSTASFLIAAVYGF